MRISDWSSDVCSSDLATDVCIALDRDNIDTTAAEQQAAFERACSLSHVVEPLLASSSTDQEGVVRSMQLFLLKQIERLRGLTFLRMAVSQPRSEERRVGKECVSSVRSLW